MVLDKVDRKPINDNDIRLPNYEIPVARNPLDAKGNIEASKTTRPLTIYLAHKFEHQDMGLAVQYELAGMGIKVLNPFQREEQEEYDHVIAHKGGYFSDPQCAKIVHADLDLIDRADGVVALLYPNAIGTVMEIFYAGHVKRLPVFTWVTYDMPYRHPWIAYYSRVFTQREPLITAIRSWATERA